MHLIYLKGRNLFILKWNNSFEPLYLMKDLHIGFIIEFFAVAKGIM